MVSFCRLREDRLTVTEDRDTARQFGISDGDTAPPRTFGVAFQAVGRARSGLKEGAGTTRLLVPTLRFAPSYRLYASRRMLKKANILTHPTRARQDAPSPKQGRRRARTGGGTNRTSWSRSPVQWILANGKTPPALPPFENIIGTLRILAR